MKGACYQIDIEVKPNQAVKCYGLAMIPFPMRREQQKNQKQQKDNRLISTVNNSSPLLQQAEAYLINIFPVMVEILLHGLEESVSRSRDRDKKRGTVFLG